ncbi:hypothetical protein INS49_002906 [Diaporthe citri]|uniref:uncharacterized protein n=1 Tax=Diaporthe citri TaxID=83186 RepID=UPI001C8035C7|nr:uncharacterized protein INS49_002906 [Diaporthe citri]KAG6368693.1 hypothetical protein INS49_002906 [Diaporthe citri]
MATYQQLQPRYIWLLEFLDDTDNQIALTNAGLDHAPNYVARSYTWGKASYQKDWPPKEVYEITLDGKMGRTWQILHDALRHLAQHIWRPSRKFWADFVCIDQ